MALTSTEAKQAKGLDKTFLLLVIQLENQIDGLSEDTAREMAALVMKQATATGVRDQDSLAKALVDALAGFFVIYSTLVLTSQQRIATAKFESDLKTIVPTLRRNGAVQEANDLRVAGRTISSDVAKRFNVRRGFEGQTVPQRIKTLQEGSEKTVRNIVANGVKEGLSARDIAKKISNYVKPSDMKVEPFKEARARFNRDGSFKPNLPAGSVRTNAMMIARTESAELYRDATSRFYKDKKWVKGFRWVLSNSHPKADVCDSLAGHGTYKPDDNRPFSHPHCVCDWQVVLQSDSAISRLVSSGAIS